VRTDDLHLGINLGPTPPPLVVVPGPVVATSSGPPPPVVYTAPSVPYNYFAYRNTYYLYYGDRWLRERQYNGPWTVISLAQVPCPILAVPIEEYRVRPRHWEHHGPPPWAQQREREQQGDHGRGHGHDKGRG